MRRPSLRRRGKCWAIRSASIICWVNPEMPFRININASLRRGWVVPKYTTLGWVGFFLFEIPIRLFFAAIFIVSCLALLRDPDPTFGFKVVALLGTCLGVLWFLIGFPLTFALVEIGEIKKDA